MRIRESSACVCLLLGSLWGCGSGEEQAGPPEPVIPVSASPAESIPATALISAEEMRKRLGATQDAQFERVGLKYSAANLAGSGATTLEPLRGQPLKQLDLTLTKISDLGPLQGMPLERLILIQTPISDLTPLAGLPLVLLDASETPVADLSAVAGFSKLEELYLEKAQVRDASPLKELSLRKLWLSHCPVESLLPLTGKSFEELNLCNTPISDFQPLSTMKIGTLWLRETSISDLSPLAGLNLTSLDLQGTKVRDLSALSGMTSLARLNIARTEVTDLTPLVGLNLTRLIFAPEKIETGLDVVRNMKSLRQLDTTFEGNAPAATPSEFWEKFDHDNTKGETPQ